MSHNQSQAGGDNRALIQELQDAFEFLKLSRNEYNQLEIIRGAVEDCCEEASPLSTTLKEKISDILLSESCSNKLSIDKYKGSALATNVLLGLSESDMNLDYEEAKILRTCIEAHLNFKLKNVNALISSFKNLDKPLPDGESLKLDKADEIILDLFTKITTKQESCLTTVCKIKDMLDQICSSKTREVPERVKQKLEEFKVNTEMNYLRDQILQKKTNQQILMETKTSLNAFKELFKDIKKQQEDIQLENAQLQDLKEEYKLVSSKQYDSILKSYLQYKKNIEKKRMIYDMCKLDRR